MRAIKFFKVVIFVTINCLLLWTGVQGGGKQGLDSKTLDQWWNDTEQKGLIQLTALNYQELVVNKPDQVWLIMLAKKRNDLCIRALGVYQQLMPKLQDKINFGYIDVLQDEALKVAFGEEAVPWTFAIFEGKAYRYYALERPDEIESYMNDLDQWKIMKVQFEVPKRPANKLEIILFDIWKEVRRAVVPMNRAYMEWFHEMRTGSKHDFEKSTTLGFSCLGAAIIVLVVTLTLICRCLFCSQQKAGSRADKTIHEKKE